MKRPDSDHAAKAPDIESTPTSEGFGLHNSPMVHACYVIAERNRRKRALWAGGTFSCFARNYLAEHCGLTDSVIDRHNIGIVHGRCGGFGAECEDALCFPVADERGPEFGPCVTSERPGARRRGQYVFLHLGQSTEGTVVRQWKRGAVLTMYLTPGGRNDLVVCSGIIEGMFLASKLEERNPERFTVIVSTHTDQNPSAWHTPEFWIKWQRVYFAYTGPQSNNKSQQLARLTQRPVLTVTIPDTRDGVSIGCWSDYFRSGGTPHSVVELFDSARIVADQASLGEDVTVAMPPRFEDFAEGEFGDVTHDIAYNFAGGYYYYPFSVLNFSYGANGQKQITRLTRLLRNDGRILGWSRVPSRNGASDVIAADDGILLSRPPEVSESATWALDNILAFAREAKADTPSGRRLADILRDIRSLFEQCIWLPFREQFYLLLFAVPVTYVQELFSAVPYLLIQGPKGSGKSELAHLLSWVSSNSTIIGSGSHAFTAAQIDQARGLIVLDDRETLSANDLDPNLLELLKIGYKRATGIRGIVGSNRRIIRQHVYGVKAITCVSGVEEVVGTRMLRIRTAPYSKTRASVPIRRFQAADQETAQRLRQELHGWAFKNVNLIRAEYDKFLQTSSRWAEITAPLRTFASLSEDIELQSRLTEALEAQARQETVAASVEEALDSAMEELIRRGFTGDVSVTHIRNELTLRLSGSPPENLHFEGGIPESWITRTLRSRGWLKPDTAVRRARVRKKVLQRLWELDPGKVSEILRSLQERPKSQEALTFCQACETCEYTSICGIKRYF